MAWSMSGYRSSSLCIRVISLMLLPSDARQGCRPELGQFSAHAAGEFAQVATPTVTREGLFQREAAIAILNHVVQQHVWE